MTWKPWRPKVDAKTASKSRKDQVVITAWVDPPVRKMARAAASVCGQDLKVWLADLIVREAEALGVPTRVTATNRP